MKLPPIVYVGPTLDPSVVKRCVPQAQLLPPIVRGDLHRSRSLGFSVFLILDGVFLEQLAISPREIIDVVRDGAIVFGAASMGAIRAAECWPAGMRGVGSIYRLYRRGVLTSDDEVAVTFSTERPYSASTISLINVRYAVLRACRNGILTRNETDRVVKAACEQHFSDREWPSILKSAGICDSDDRRLKALQTYDLKALDGFRAVKTLQRWDERGIETRRAARVRSRDLSAVRPREPLNGVGRRVASIEPLALWRWLVASGRYRRYASALSPADTKHRRIVQAHSRANRRNKADLATEAASYVERSADLSAWLSIDAKAVAGALARGRSSAPLVGMLMAHERVFGPAVWAEMSALGDTDAVVLRFVGLQRAIERARACSLVPEARDHYVAHAEIANSHGFSTWLELQDALRADPRVLSMVEHASDELALAKRVRYELFGGGRARHAAQQNDGSR